MLKRYFIQYYPAIAAELGSANGALLLSKLEHLSACMGHRKFYKFLEPCAHDFYEVGQSLTEELGLSENQIRTALDSFCITYNGKKQFKDNIQNLFSDGAGKKYFYCRLLDKRAGLTYYYRNHIEVEKFLKNFEVNFGYKVNLMKSNKLVSGHGQPLSPDTHNNHLIQINNKTQKINNKKQQMVEMIRKFETSMDKKLLL